MPLVRKGPPTPPPQEQDPLADLGSPDPNLRWSAARTAWALPGGVPALGRRLSVETEEHVREAIFTALAHAASAESVAIVTPFVRADDAALRTGALDALRTMPDAVRPHVAALLDDDDADVRLLSCEIVRALPNAEAALLMRGVIENDPSVNVCAAALEVLAETAGAEDAPALQRCAERLAGEPFVAFAVGAVLRRIGAAAR